MSAYRDVAIIGAGPAGIAAAVYLKRVGVNPLLIERDRVGGLLQNANLVENYPGFPDGIRGGDLVKLLEAHLRRWRIKVMMTEVKRITKDGGHYLLHTARGTFSCRYLVVATGTRPRSIDLPGLDSVPKRKVFYEVADVSPEFDRRRFIVIGGGDAAFDYSLSLASRGCHTDIVFKSNRPRCIPLLLARVRKEKMVRLFPGSTPESVSSFRSSIALKCRGSRGMFELQGDAVLIACGRDPEMGILPGSRRWREEATGNEEKRRGLFIAGDVERGIHRQVGIAVGDGIRAAMMIADRLKEDSDEDIG